MDIIGKRVGRLKVVRNSNRKGYVICECDCGNICQVPMYNLTKKSNQTRSCGCLRREKAKANIYKNSARRLEMIEKYGTNIGIISNRNPRRDNKTGHKGVWYDRVHDIYQARISFRGRKYHLGTFHNIRDAIAAREEAEEHLYAPVLAEALAEW